MSGPNLSDSAQKVNKNQPAKTTIAPEPTGTGFELAQRSPKMIGSQAVSGDDPIQAALLCGPEGVFGGGSLGHQVARLNNPRLATVQRQSLVARIGRVQGNRHLQAMIASLRGDPKQPSSASNMVRLQNASINSLVSRKPITDEGICPVCGKVGRGVCNCGQPFVSIQRIQKDKKKDIKGQDKSPFRVHKLPKTIQRSDETGQQSGAQASADVIIDALEGWTSSEDSARILAEFKGSSQTEATLTELKGRGAEHGATPQGMVEWLMGDLVDADRSELVKIFIDAEVKDGIDFAAKEIHNLLSGWTSEADQAEILTYFYGFTGDSLSQILTSLEGATGLNRGANAGWLFDDLTSLDGEKLRAHFFASGSATAGSYAAISIAQKIADLIAGYTGGSDSTDIVANFERTPEVHRPAVLKELDDIAQARWETSAEDSLMEDMPQEDYEKLRQLGLPIRPYDYEKAFLEGLWDKVLSGVDFVTALVQYGVCSLAGVVWGGIEWVIDIIVLVKDIVLGVADLIGMVAYFISSGTVGRDSYNRVSKFLEGLGQLCNAPGEIIKASWDQLVQEASLMEGPLKACQQAVHWVSTVTKLVVDIILTIFVGYGVIKAIASGAKTVITLAKAGKYGAALGRILSAPGRLVLAAGGDLAAFAKLLSRPAETIKAVRTTITAIRMAAADEGYWKLLRTKAGTFIEGEKLEWQEIWTGGAAESEAAAGRIEATLTEAAGTESTPDDAVKLIEQADQDALAVKSKTDDILDEVSGKKKPKEETSPRVEEGVTDEPIIEGMEFLAEFENVTLGEKIGEGAYKIAYAIGGRDDLVIAILKAEQDVEIVAKEIALLNRLKELGMPTVEILGTTRHGGQPAIVMKRYLIGSKDIFYKGGSVEDLNMRSLEDLNKIRQAIVENRLVIGDLQFLVGSNGEVVIADPLLVEFGPPSVYAVDQMIGAVSEKLLKEALVPGQPYSRAELEGLLNNMLESEVMDTFLGGATSRAGFLDEQGGNYVLKPDIE